MNLLHEHASRAIREKKIDNYFSQIIAIDASMSIYQFLISVRAGNENLTNEQGQITSHIAGKHMNNRMEQKEKTNAKIKMFSNQMELFNVCRCVAEQFCIGMFYRTVRMLEHGKHNKT
jgi:hypothetical protein